MLDFLPHTGLINGGGITFIVLFISKQYLKNKIEVVMMKIQTYQCRFAEFSYSSIDVRIFYVRINP